MNKFRRVAHFLRGGRGGGSFFRGADETFGTRARALRAKVNDIFILKGYPAFTRWAFFSAALTALRKTDRGGWKADGTTRGRALTRDLVPHAEFGSQSRRSTHYVFVHSYRGGWDELWNACGHGG